MECWAHVKLITVYPHFQSPIRVRKDVQKVDRIWPTCCGLHNWLIDVDGLAEDYRKLIWPRHLGKVIKEGTKLWL